jgi:D-alanyl-D-alanine carboxypeptidase
MKRSERSWSRRAVLARFAATAPGTLIGGLRPAFAAAGAAAADALVADYMTRFDTPALSAASARGKAPVDARAWGWADRQRRAPATIHSRFRIASVSKPLTATALFTLIEAGRLRLDDRVFAPNSLLPEFAALGPQLDWLHAITVHQLLTHTAGGWPNDGSDPMFEPSGLDQRQLIAHTLRTLPLVAAPGERFAYSNFGYCVLGRVIERVSGLSYERYVREHVLEPAGVRAMQIAASTPADDEVHYYSQDRQDPYRLPIARMDSHGGWIATPSDLVRCLVAIFSARDRNGAPTLLSATSLAEMTRPTTANPAYACGWRVNPAGNCWHTGSLSGTTSLMVHSAAGLSWAATLNTRVRDEAATLVLDQLMWKLAPLLAR